MKTIKPLSEDYTDHEPTVTLHAKIPSDLKRDLAAMAERNERSISAQARIYIREGLKNMRDGNDR